ncbi:MAG: hypothetical protein AB7O97_11685 [Planctomycetota bacterium]
MKGLEKLTCVRLAEVISQKNIVSSEVITDALYAQDKYGDPFVQTLVTGGHITEWDLAKLVAENFQLPFLMASSYAISDDAKKRLPEKILFENMLVPLDVFDDTICVVMPILSPYDVLGRIQRELKCELFPYVGLISENKKVLGDMFGDFAAWHEQDKKRREQAATKRANTKSAKGDWMSIFDAGDAAIQDTLGEPAPPKKPAPRR